MLDFIVSGFCRRLAFIYHLISETKISFCRTSCQTFLFFLPPQKFFSLQRKYSEVHS